MANEKQKKINTLWDRLFDRLNDGFTNLLVIRVFVRSQRENDELGSRANIA